MMDTSSLSCSTSPGHLTLLCTSSFLKSESLVFCGPALKGRFTSLAFLSQSSPPSPLKKPPSGRCHPHPEFPQQLNLYPLLRSWCWALGPCMSSCPQVLRTCSKMNSSFHQNCFMSSLFTLARSLGFILNVSLSFKTPHPLRIFQIDLKLYL